MVSVGSPSLETLQTFVWIILMWWHPDIMKLGPPPLQVCSHLAERSIALCKACWSCATTFPLVSFLSLVQSAHAKNAATVTEPFQWAIACVAIPRKCLFRLH